MHDLSVWLGTRAQVLASIAASHNMAPGLTEGEVLEVCQELGIKVPELVPEGYVWDGSEY
jgi:hypothetical protein